MEEERRPATLHVTKPNQHRADHNVRSEHVDGAEDDWGFFSSLENDDAARVPVAESESDDGEHERGMAASFMLGSIAPGGWGDLSASFMAGPPRRLDSSSIDRASEYTDEEDKPEWLHETPLGEAVASLDVPLVRKLLDENHNARITDQHFNTLLHVVANPRFNKAHTFDSWTELLQATRDMVNMLVANGVKIDRENGSGCPPILVTVANYCCQWVNETSNLVYHQPISRRRTYWAQGHAIVALLEAGADTSWSKITRGWQAYSILDICLHTLPQDTRFPETWDLVLKTLISKVPNLSAIVGEEPTVHKLLRAGIEPDRLQVLLQKLMDPVNPRPYRIDCVDVKGNTALLALILERTKWSESTIRNPLYDDLSDYDESEDEDDDYGAGKMFTSRTVGLIKTLVGAGARLDYLSTMGDTVLTMAYSAPWRYDLYERHVVSNMLQLILMGSCLPGHCKPGHSRLVDVTPTWILADAIHRGRTKIAGLLLKYGMKDRLHEIDTHSYTYTTEESNLVTIDLDDCSLVSGPPGRERLFSPNDWHPSCILSNFAFARVGKTGKFLGEKRYHGSGLREWSARILPPNKDRVLGYLECMELLAEQIVESSRNNDPDNKTPDDSLSVPFSKVHRTFFERICDQKKDDKSPYLRPDELRREWEDKIKLGDVKAEESFRPSWRRSYSFAGMERERLKPPVAFASTLYDEEMEEPERPRAIWRRDSLSDLDAVVAAGLALKTFDGV